MAAGTYPPALTRVSASVGREDRGGRLFPVEGDVALDLGHPPVEARDNGQRQAVAERAVTGAFGVRGGSPST